ncbi:MAG: tyrosine-protein phosphatase [Elusimicrobiales bacterium]|jgi:hypothetical protein
MLDKMFAAVILLATAVQPALAEGLRGRYYEGLETFLEYSENSPKPPAQNDIFQDTIAKLGYPRVPVNQNKYQFPIQNFGAIRLTREPAERMTDEMAFRGGPLGYEVNEMDYKLLKAVGVQSTSSIQTIHPVNMEKCGQYGLKCENFKKLPFDMTSWRGSENFQYGFKFAVDELKAGRKIYIHCMAGNDRTGMFAAALTIRGQACGIEKLDGENKKLLTAAVSEALLTYRFWPAWFSKWQAEADDWVENFEQHREWLCQ